MEPLEKKCCQCGKTFYATRATQLYCSKACSNARLADYVRQKRSQKPYFEKVCLVCGKRFRTRHGRKKTCSAYCGREMELAHRREVLNAQREERLVKCARCGTVFRTRSSRRKYCSAECSRQKAYYRECLVCGKEFSTTSAKRSTCSKICFYQLRNGKEREFQEKALLTTALPVQNPDSFQCVICGKIFTPIRYNQMTCSQECKYIHKRMYKELYCVRRRFLCDDMDTGMDEDSYADMPVESVLHGECPYALGLLRSDARFLPVL